MNGSEILNNPFLNKGTAFTKEERRKYGLEGLLPGTVQSLNQQAAQAYEQFQSKATDLEKRIFLMTVFNTNRVLFYKLMSGHVVELMPIVYTPTVALAIEQYNELFIEPQNAAFLSIDEPEAIRDSLRNAASGRDIRLIVVTDAGAILGIGDWGVNGVDIAIGKLMVYTAAAGINPNRVLAVSLDVGTRNPRLLSDPLYLGNRHERVDGERYYDFIDRFVNAAEELFPNMLLHWEDFGRANAAAILDTYKDRFATFNDDIQGTGIVVLAGVLGALNISGKKFTNQVFMIFGAGTAGVGIANQLLDEMMRHGLNEAETREHFYLVDRQGLLFEDTDGLTDGQKPFVRRRGEFADAEELTTLEAAVKAVRPTALIGASGQPGAFTETVAKAMAAHTERPIIFPLSNPTKLTEAKAEDLIWWTDGRALVATGTPTGDVTHNGVTHRIGQSNNALMFPGLGLGLLASTATRLTGETLSRASHALGGIVDASKPGAAVLPPVSRLTEFSQAIAEVVGQSVIDQKLNREPVGDIKKAVEAIKWLPEYQDPPI